MPLIAASPPQPVPLYGHFDYVHVDAARRRVYAAHGGNSSLLIVDADSGKVLGQVEVGDMAGSAVNPANGHVFTGNGNDRSVSEVDPVAMTDLRDVDLPGNVDGIIYDPAGGKIYADEDDGTKIFVIDAKTFKQVATIHLPGHKPESLDINASKHELYQNISDLAEVVVIDLNTDKVVRTFKTPELSKNHPLQYDAAFDRIIVGGGGVLASYDTGGKLLHKIAVPQHIDQCSLDQQRHLLACAGGSKITVVKDAPDGSLKVVGQLDVAEGVHTVGIDAKTGDIWGVWAAQNGDWVQRFQFKS